VGCVSACTLFIHFRVTRDAFFLSSKLVAGVVCCHMIQPLPTQHDLWQAVQYCFVQAAVDRRIGGGAAGVPCADSLCCVGAAACYRDQDTPCWNQVPAEIALKIVSKIEVCVPLSMCHCHNCCIRVVVRMLCTLGLLNACYTRAVSSAPWWTWFRQHRNHPSRTCMLSELLCARLALIRCCMCSSMLVGTAVYSNVLMHSVLLPCVL
jgi:hypothetical protein